MNNITKPILTLLLALFQATAFAYEVGDIITEDGVKYFVVEKHFKGRFKYADKKVKDDKQYLYEGQVLAIGTDKTTKHICIAEKLQYETKKAAQDTTTTVERFFLMGINDYAFANEDVESISLPTCLDCIGDGAFRNMKVTKGSLWMPFVKKYGEGVFTGLKADLIFRTSWVKPYSDQDRIYSKLNHTFEPADSLPTIIVRSSALKDYTKSNGWPTDQMLCYGYNLLEEKRESELAVNENCMSRVDTVNALLVKQIKYIQGAPSYSKPLGTSFAFATADTNGVLISVNKMKFRKKEKNPYAVYNDARDAFATPYLYSYESIQSPSIEMNDQFFRLEDKDTYVYFTTDGKKVEHSVVADKDGLDPFGTRIISKEEIEKRKAKEVNIKKLDKRTDDLMKRFGF